MRKTTQISFSCQISGFTFYWLEFDDAVGSYYFCRDVKASDYNKNNTSDFLNPVYKMDNTMVSESSVSPNNPSYYFLRLPIIRDSVVMQDFYAFEDKSIPSGAFIHSQLPIGSGQGWTYNVGRTGSPSRPYEAPKGCDHNWETYTGLHEVETYCTKCKEKA